MHGLNVKIIYFQRLYKKFLIQLQFKEKSKLDQNFVYCAHKVQFLELFSRKNYQIKLLLNKNGYLQDIITKSIKLYIKQIKERHQETDGILSKSTRVQNPPESKSTRSKSTRVKIHPIKINPIKINPSQNPPNQNPPDQNQPEFFIFFK